MSARRCGRRRGLTLLEVIISIALIALLLGSLLTFFWQTLEARERVQESSVRTQIVRQLFDKMAGELRGCLGVETVHFTVAHFAGDRRSLTFITSPLPSKDSFQFYRETDEQPVARHDLREVRYELWIDQDETTDDGEPLVGGILRTERRVYEPFETKDDVPEGEDLLYIRRDLWSPELGYLEFRYFDGVEWSTTWEVSQGNPLPQMVQITVGFDSILNDDLEDQDLERYPISNDQFPLGPDEFNPNRYSKMVRLRSADPMFTSRLYKLGDEVQETYDFGGPVEGEVDGEGLEGEK